LPCIVVVVFTGVAGSPQKVSFRRMHDGAGARPNTTQNPVLLCRGFTGIVPFTGKNPRATKTGFSLASRIDRPQDEATSNGFPACGHCSRAIPSPRGAGFFKGMPEKPERTS